MVGKLKKAVHSYLDVFDGANWHVLEGIGDGGSLALFGKHLNAYDTTTGALNIDQPTTNHVDWDSAKDSSLSMEQICDDVAKLMGAADNFPKNQVKYDYFGKFAPNSNSFARYLLTFAPDLGSIVAPEGSDRMVPSHFWPMMRKRQSRPLICVACLAGMLAGLVVFNARPLVAWQNDLKHDLDRLSRRKGLFCNCSFHGF